ncbi:hypothetical protein pb186bvf_005799 [Paramecium bursaria]
MNLQRQLQSNTTYLCDQFDTENYKSIILDLSELRNPQVQQYIQQNLNVQLMPIEVQYYEEKKEFYDDQSDLEQRTIELFIQDLQLKDYIKGIVLDKSQFHFTSQLAKDQNILSLLQNQQSTIKRGTVLDINEDPKEISEQLKSIAIAQRAGIQFYMLKIQVNLDETNEDELNQFAQQAKRSQLLGFVPLLDIKFFSDKLNRDTYLRLCSIAFSKINYALIKNEIELEQVILATNIAEQYIRVRYPIIINNNNQQQMQVGRETAYKIVQTLFRSLPPALYAIFFTLDREFLKSKYFLSFMNYLNDQNMFTSWVYGLLLKPQTFDEVYRSYSKIRRSQGAVITLNQCLKVFQDANQAKYKPNQEEQELKPIEIGSL